jgi:hypothetical protein
MTTRKEQKPTGRGVTPRRRAPGRHEKAVEVSLLDLERAGMLAPHTGHLRTALRANGRALDEAETTGNAYGTRQATRSLLELHEALTARRDDEGDVSTWLAQVPDTVPDDLA